MDNKNFMMTMDENFANQLVAEGFQLINKTKGCFIFINCPTKMTKEYKSKVIYTNTLCI